MTEDILDYYGGQGKVDLTGTVRARDGSITRNSDSVGALFGIVAAL